MLGQLAVRGESEELYLGSPKQRAVLAVLLLNANEIVPTDRIVDLVWGDNPPRTAEHSVQIYISELRKALARGSADELIDTRPPGYIINVPPNSVDTLSFERAVRDGLASIRAGDFGAGRHQLETAVAHWNGEPLADFRYEEFAQGYIRSLTELRSDALEALAALDLEEGALDSARDLARQAIDADPLREAPRRVMMLSLYRSGRQADALRHFAEYRDLLVEDLGIEPSDGLRLLEERVLLGDPSLHPSAALSADGNPYRGLRAFSEADADVFFGREALVEEVLQRLDAGTGFVSIVGPSGSGKSSAVRAGLIPKLRERGESVVVVQPGPRPLFELAEALGQAGFGTGASLVSRLETDRSAVAQVLDRSVVLIVDQFEELFTLSESDVAVMFSELLANAVRDPRVPLRVVATLRADYYDKPLAIPALADVFSDSVVGVKPMTPVEIERAVVQPAVGCGAVIEPALVAQLVADMGDRPGALPLLQYTLFELYERGPGFLSMDGYRKLGGLQGALGGAADELLARLDLEGRSMVEQLMMRLVRRGQTLVTSRPVALRELLELGIDRVALQSVLEALGSRRLITFDRDGSGAAIVEMAHEYLISEWPQMESWLKAHSDDLDRLHSLDNAVRDWADAGRSADYLLRGDRLAGFEQWGKETSLLLTELEREFVASSARLRAAEEDEIAEREARAAALARSARRRLWAFGSAVAALAAAVTMLIVAITPPPPPDLVVLIDSRGDHAFGDLVGSGIDMAAEEFDLDVFEISGGPAQLPQMDVALETGAPLAIMLRNTANTPAALELIAKYPETHFVLVDCVTDGEDFLPNVACITARNVELGYLAGVVSALVSETGRVGFIGGVDLTVIHEFQAGFEQGVEHIDADIAVDVLYLSGWNGIDVDDSGFFSSTLGDVAAQQLIADGADVLFPAAGFSAYGAFRAVGRANVDDTGPWSIGVDVDQRAAYEVFTNADEEVLARDASRILTSVLKRLDLAVVWAVEEFLATGTVTSLDLTLSNGAVGYSTTGGHMTRLEQDLADAIDAVVSGRVVLDVGRRSEIVMLSDVVAP